MPKLLIAVVHEQDVGRLVDALRSADFRVTEVPSRGGFLKARNSMIYIGVDDEHVDRAMTLIDENCQSRTVSVPAEALGGLEAVAMPTEVMHGGATVFVVALEEIRRI